MTDPAQASPSLTPLQRAFTALERTRAELQAVREAAREPIAVIGLGCRVPGGANDAESFWRLLNEGREAIGPIPRDRWDVDAFYHPDPEHVGAIATKAGGFLNEIDTFDPAFFGITRREAQGMDPQQRLLLEVCWEALEHAGQPPDRLERSSTGVYVGVTGNDYTHLQLETGDRSLLDAHFASGIAHSIISGRLSYLLGLQGPSLTIDTACSSSLVAVHLACQALRAGECRMALAGGVNLILSPDLYIALSRARMLAPDGRCKPFDASADGFARGEGCGVIVLKRLRDAQADGDRVLAVIRGSAVNQDGASSGLTAPNGPAQEAVIREALARAGVEPRLVSYIEAHGTGTQLGDPIELRALGSVFAQGRDPGRPLPVGSVKSNVGHLEAAAGIVGLIKVVLALRRREIPAHLNCPQPTPHVSWPDLGLTVPTTARTWLPIEGRRLAGVSSFGFSGTNAHIVLEQGPEATAVAASTERRRLFVLSAFDPPALRALAARYAQALADRPDLDLAAVCRTAALRAHHTHRAAIVAGSTTELRTRLEAVARGDAVDGVRTGIVHRRDPIKVAFLYSGQGSQAPDMGRHLFETEPVFRAAIEECAAILGDTLDAALTEVLYPPAGQPDALPRIHQTRYTQPALFALEYALTRLWQSWGVKPAAVIGHSIGEYVAAHIAGVLSLEDALRLVAVRGRLMQSLPPGDGMTVIFAPAEEVAPRVAAHREWVAIAAINGDAQTVISGQAELVNAIAAQFSEAGVRVQPLTVSHAFHSPLVDRILSEFEEAAAQVRFARPVLPLVSNLTGRLADANVITTPGYWRAHVREPVRFADGLKTLATMRPDVCLEVGPHSTLLPMAGEAFGDQPTALVGSLRRGMADGDSLDDALATLYVTGAVIDWRAVWSSRPVSLVDLPGYAFQRERCWFFARRPRAGRGKVTGHPLLGSRLSSGIREIVQFEADLHPADLPYLRDHQVLDRQILPAAAFLEMALAAARQTTSDRTMLQDVVIGEPLVVTDAGSRRVQTIVRLTDGLPSTFEILSTDSENDEAEWLLHVSGSYMPAEASAGAPESSDLPALSDEVTGPEHLTTLEARGLVFGPSLRGVQRIRSGHGAAVGDVQLVPDEHTSAYQLPPQLLDACLQVMVAALPGNIPAGAAYLPFAIDRMNVYRTPGEQVTSQVSVVSRNGEASGTLTAHVVISDARGVVATLDGITLRVASDMRGGAEASASSDLYAVEWEPIDDKADWMPNVDALVAEAGARLPELVIAHDLAEYHQGFLKIERLATNWIVRALMRLGWRPVVGDRIAVEALADQLGIVPRYQRLLGRFLQMLEEDGLLRREAENFVVTRVPADVDPAADADALALQHPSSRARLDITRRCGNELAGVLVGSVDPLELLFPAGSTTAATALYHDNPEAVAFNELVREAVQTIARRLPANRTLRVLEVGGGTGGTTLRVAPALDPARTQYLFTDLGPSLVSAARERFGGYSFMEFATLDLERDPSAQLGDRQFDLILAANVVHATADLRRTLGHLSTLLAPGGTLLMLEVAGRERWIDLTFGLTKGWWRFSDLDLRPAYPLLGREQWLSFLRDSGLDAAPVNTELPESREVLLAARKALAARVPAGRQWLILADTEGIGAALAQRLQHAGHTVSMVMRADAAADIATAIGERVVDDLNIVYLWGLDIPTIEAIGRDEPVTTQAAALQSLLALVQSLGRASFAQGAPPRLWVATRGTQCEPSAGGVTQAPIWGMALGIAREHPELRPVQIDLDPSGTAEMCGDALMEALGRAASEDLILSRGGVLHGARLSAIVSANAPKDIASGEMLRLERAESGILDDLALVARGRAVPGPGEVEVEIVAAGLNFRDVMNAIALRDDPEPLGGECAGRVSAVGAGVTSFAVGDDIVTIAEAALSTHAIARADHVALLPPRVTFAEAATVPFAYMTARFALRDCAKLQPGETVLIHAAAGGVGLAAVRLAQAAGATVIATAGSDAKRAFLRAAGVPDVFDSRSVAFEEEVLRVTGGRGVDVVLNSIAGEAIGASVRCLTETGRFVEIGKRDIWPETQFLGVRPHGRYFAVDLAALRAQASQQSAALFQDVVRDLTTGRLKPLPLRAFALEAAADAFRHMAQTRHIGKIVLLPDRIARTAFDRITGEATYLITGGLTGLGLVAAQQLVDLGARQLVLVGRRPPNAAARAVIEQLHAHGVTVHVVSADVSDPMAVNEIIADIDASMPPLRGVIHSAGALADGTVMQQTWDRFVSPFEAKVNGTWALHDATLRHRLDFFVLYSSVVSVFGSSGQANHAAANSFLDTLARYRRAHGLPATSISWGAWSEVGAAADRQVDLTVKAHGIGVISPAHGRELLKQAIASGAPHVAAVPVSWDAFVAERGSTGGQRFFERVVGRTERKAATSASSSSPVDAIDMTALREATSVRRLAVLLEFVGEQVAKVVGAASAHSIAVDQPLQEIGLDSLMAVDLRNRLARGLALPRSLPATLVFDHPTLDALTSYLASLVAPDGVTTGPAPSKPTAGAATAIGELSDDEVEALFKQRMGGQRNGVQ